MKAFSDARLAVLQRLIWSRLGHDPQRFGKHHLLQAVARLAASQDQSDMDACIERLQGEPESFEALIDELVVAETWFFRDREPFHCLRQRLSRLERDAGRIHRPRILCLPCSTGEEAYSAAMILLGLGLQPSEFQVDAADVSHRLLHQAKTGVFARSSFRGDELEFSELCERYLEPRGDKWVTTDTLRKSVRFVHANLLAPRTALGTDRYDMILCRNVLIYMHADARAIALANLRRLLLPNGVLYVGHVEAQLVGEIRLSQLEAAEAIRSSSSPHAQGDEPKSATSPRRAARHLDADPRAFISYGTDYPSAFVSAGDSKVEQSTGSDWGAEAPSGAVAARNVAAGNVAARNVAAGNATPRTLPARRPTTTSGVSPAPTAESSGRATAARHSRWEERGGPEVESSSVNASAAELLDLARQAADHGRTSEAESLARQIVQRDPTNIEATFLLALVTQAQGKSDEARELFRRVLYLDPQHEQSLVHMMLLARHQNDAVAAANYLRRIENLREQKD